MTTINFKKIKLVAKQEFNNVVRNKRFFFTTLLSPIILAVVFFLSILIPMANTYFGEKQEDNQENQTNSVLNTPTSQVTKNKINVLVVDSTGGIMQPIFKNNWASERNVCAMKYIDADKHDLSGINLSSFPFVIYYPKNFLYKNEFSATLNTTFYDQEFFNFLKSETQLQLVRYIVETNKKVSLADVKLPTIYSLRFYTQDSEELEAARLKQREENLREEEHKNADKTVKILLSFMLALSLYRFIDKSTDEISFAVIEEKNNKLIDILFTCVKPLEFITGKIIGIYFIRLAKLSLYIIFVIICIIILLIWNPDIIHDEQSSIGIHFIALTNINNYVQIIALYVFYFLCGYLMFGALYAGFCSTVDRKGNPPAIMTTLGIILTLGYLVSYTAYLAPDGPISFFFSIFPFTAPFCMLARIPFGVANWQILVSMIITFVTVVWTLRVSSRLYTMGVQLYGNDISSKEILYYLKNKNIE